MIVMRWLLGLLICFLIQVAGAAASPAGPIPLEAIVGMRHAEGRSEIAPSPRNDWIALVYQDQPLSPTSTIGRHYSDTGVSYSEWLGLRRILLVRRSDGHTLNVLGDPSATAMAW